MGITSLVICLSSTSQDLAIDSQRACRIPSIIHISRFIPPQMPKLPANVPTGPSHTAVARTQVLAPPSNNPWNGSHATLRKTAISNAASQVSNTNTQVPRSSNPSGGANPSASQASQMNISGSSVLGTGANSTAVGQGPRGQQYMNPSIPPSGSMISVVPGSVTGSACTGGSQRRNLPRPFRNAVCELSNYAPEDYRLGEIYWVSFHQPNTDPNLQPGDVHLEKTMAGHVYTKKRMAIVLWTYAQDVFCLPVYTFKGQGVLSKPAWLVPEYVCLQNDDDSNFRNHGQYDPVVAYRKRTRLPFHPQATVHINGGFKLPCVADVSYCGRLTEESYLHLMDLWKRSFDNARLRQY